MSVQEINKARSENRPTESVQAEEIGDIQPGDIIIQMTDGAWSEFDFLTEISRTESGEIWKEYQINEEQFQKVLKEELRQLSDKSLPLSYRVAQAITNHALKKTIDQRQQYLDLMKKIEDYLPVADETQTITTWLSELPDKDIADQLRVFLFESEHDGVRYTDDAPATMVIDWLKNKMCFGDCTTVSVLEAPNFGVELLRAYTENPKKQRSLLSKIKKYFSSEDEIEAAFQRLEAECFLRCKEPSKGGKLATIKFQKIYPALKINMARITLLWHLRKSNSKEIPSTWCGFHRKKGYRRSILAHATKAEIKENTAQTPITIR